MHRSRLSVGVALVLAFSLTTIAGACVLAKRLAAVNPHLTEEQIQKLAHDPSHRTTIPYKFDGVANCLEGQADIFPCSGVDLLGFFSPSQLGASSGNDLWGWTDPETGIEYALMGLNNGTAFVSLEDPDNPIYLGRLPSVNNQSSTWRDVGVYANHAFIVADNVSNHGMQVFDLTQLRNVENPPVTFAETTRYPGFDRSHNVVVNEDTGFAYAVGSNTCNGGLHIIDIRNPTTPVEAGCFSGDGYTHDAQCVVYHGPDPDYQGREICFNSNEDTLTIVDVTDKSAPIMIGRQGYANSGYVHQGWLTEDHKYFLIDDELDEMIFGHNTRSYIWDVTDLDNPALNGFYEATGGAAIDHNQYVHGDYVYQANYLRGLRILRLDDPATAKMTEVAFIDTAPQADGNSFGGAWSTYPYFDSGLILISDLNRGLFIVKPTELANPPQVFSDGFESGDTSEWSNQGEVGTGNGIKP